MLESLVATVLNRVVGSYVENFDPKQLNIGLLSGDVKLRNLKMKRAALDKLHLPLNVKEGHIGSLILQIPYSNLKNKPVKIFIEDVLVLARPDLHPDDSDYKRRVQRSKLDKLELWELSHEAKQEEDPNAPQTSSFVSKIIDNLQVTIKNIHIRYEDAECVPEHPFAMGVTLGELSAVSTTKDWEPAFISEVSSTSHKLATLDSFSVYWDTDADSMEVNGDAFRSRITDLTGQYMVRPVNGQGYITLNKRPKTEATPKIHADLQFEEFALGLEGGQYRDILAVADQFQLYFRTREYRQYRPRTSPKEDPRGWWKYAMNTVLKNVQERKRVWNWDNFNQRMKDMKQYMSLYEKQYSTTLSATEKKEFEEIEENYKLEDLILFRSLAKRNMKTKPKPVKATWSSWLWGGSAAEKNAESGEPTDGPIEITDQQKEEFMSIFDEPEKNVSMNQIVLSAEVSLKSGSVRLKQDSSNDVAALFFNTSELKFIKRANNLLFGLSLGSFGITDLCKDSHYPDVVKAYERKNAKASTDQLFWLLFEHNPLDGSADSTLSLKSQSVKIVYTALFVERLIHFFTPPDKSQAVDAIVDAASRTVEELREQTRLGLEYALQNHKSLMVKLDIDAPIIVVPENPRIPDSGVLVFDTGHIRLASELAPKDVIEDVKSKQAQRYTEEDWKRLEKLMFDRFRISLIDTQVLIGPHYNETVGMLDSAENSQFHILNRSTLDFLLMVSIVPTVVTIPRCKIAIDLQKLDMYFTDVQYKLFLSIIQNASPTINAPQIEEIDESIPVLHHRPTEVTRKQEQEKNSHVTQVLFELSLLISEANLHVAQGWSSNKIADICLHSFALDYKLRNETMLVGVTVDDFLIEDFVNKNGPSELRKIVESAGHGDDSVEKSKLLTVKYQKSEQDGVNRQNVDLNLASLTFIIDPTSLLTVYDYVMSTFTSPAEPVSVSDSESEVAVASSSEDTISVKINLQSITAKVNEDNVIVNTMELSSARMTVDLQGVAMKFQCVLGAVSIVDDVNKGADSNDVIRHLLSIEGGGDLADIRYETVPTDEYDAYVYFRSGSLKLSMVEEPISRLLCSLSKLLQMKSLYDQARMLASNQALSFEPPERMKLDVVMKAPIIVFPRFNDSHLELFSSNLGEIYVQNSFDAKKVQTLTAGFRNLNVFTELYFAGEKQVLEIVKDADLGIKATIQNDDPSINGSGSFDPTTVEVTDHQYRFLMECISSVTQLIANVGGMDNTEVGEVQQHLVDLKQIDIAQWNTPAEPTADGAKTINFEFDAPEFELKLYNDTDGARSNSDLDKHALSLFKLDSSHVKVQNDGKNNMSVDLTVKSFIVDDLRSSSENRFPHIIPAATHGDHQLMCRYTQSPGRPPNVDVSLDSVRAIVALDYLLALQRFSTVPTADTITEEVPGEVDNYEPEALTTNDYHSFIEEESRANEVREASEEQEPTDSLTSDQPANSAQPAMTFGVSVLDLYAFIVADSTREDTEAIVFKVEHIVASVNKHSSLGISKVGMYLTRMHSNDDSKLRLLDDFNITLNAEAIDNTRDAHLTKVFAHIDPLVFRVSVREILMATNILQKASALWVDNAKAVNVNTKFSKVTLDGRNASKSFKSGKRTQNSRTRRSTTSGVDSQRRESSSKVLGEQLQIETSGFRSVIIDSHHMPMLDFVVRPFNVRVHNWSSDLSADAQVEMYSNVYSFTKSAWEPLIDRAKMFFHMSKPHAEHAPVINVQTKDITNFEITSELIELVEQVQTYFQQDPEKVFSQNRQDDGHPYRIINQTGFDISVWSETTEHAAETREVVMIPHGGTEKWSFFDWRKMREELGGMSQEVNLGIELKDSPFQPLHSVNVNMVGEHLYLLKPSEEAQHRLAVEIFVKDSLKYVLIRSTICVANETLVPLVVRLVNRGHEIDRVIEPGDRIAAPVLDVDAEIYVKPKNGNYSWSSESLWWRELRKKEYGVECPGHDDSFFIHARPYYPRDIPLQNHYPYMTINLCAPIELINNLPFDLEYRLYCKNTRVDWKNTIKTGEESQIHVVNRSQLLLLSVEAPEAGYRSEPIVVHSASPDFDIEHRMLLKNSTGHRLKLDIKYVDMPKSQGSAIVIMAPYVILNNTGRNITVSTKINHVECEVEHDNEDGKLASRPYMWSFEHPDSRNKAVIKVEDSGYTSPISFTALGTTSEITVPSRDHHREMYLGFSLKEGQGKFKRTNVVTVAPRFVLYNRMDRPILYREPGELDAISTLQPDSYEPIGFVSNMSNCQMCLNFTSGASKWSSAFLMSNVGTTYVRIREEGKPTTLVKVEIVLQESTLFIYLTKCTNWPYSIRNLTDLEFEFYQANPNVDEDGIERRSFTPIMYRLPPLTAMPYAWDFPAASVKELVLTHEGKQRKIQLAEIGELEPSKFPGPDGSYAVDFNVIANGPLQTLVISPFSNETSNYNIVRTNTRASSTASVNNTKFEVDEADDTQSATYFQFELEGLGVSYINRHSQEFCYATFRNITVVYRISEMYEYISTRVQWIQVDNCLAANTEYPVMVYPTVLPKSGDEIQQHPVFSASVARVNDESYGLTYIKHATVLLQEMTIEIDEDILVSVLQMIKRSSEGEVLRNDRSTLCTTSLSIPAPPSTISNKDIYFEMLHLQPLQVNLSFMRTGALSESDLFSALNGGVGYFLDAMSMAIGNINDAPIRLNALMMENVRTTNETLQRNISTYYSQELLYQLYKVLGSVDIIGNPVGLFNNISSGVMDLFYEPYLGYTMTDRPQDLGIGIAKGGASFLKKTVFGVSDSVSKVTGSIAKGLLAVTMDAGYQRRLRAAHVRNRPGNALFGFSYGASAFASSFASALSGLAMAPLEGATAEGAPGFFKGVAKGIFGLPTKTTIGVLDFASNVSEGIRNNTTVFDNNTILRTRPPRVIQQDKIVRPYNERDAIGQQLLHTMNNGRYKDDQFLAYTQVSSGDVVLVSYEHILCLRLEGMKEQWSIEYRELRSIGIESTGINLKLRDGVQGPFIPVPQEDSRKYLTKSIGKAVSTYNQLKSTIA